MPMSYSVAIVAALSLAASCNRSRESHLATDSATGDISADSAAVGAVFHGVKYPLTSQNYRKWLVAQAALDSVPEPSEMPRVDLRDPTDEDIERTVNFLVAQDAMRRAIERSGLSVRDFVLTSVALGQAFNVAGGRSVPEENRVFVDSNRVELERVRAARRFHVVDDDEDNGHDRGHGKEGKRGHDHKHGHRHGHGHKH
jgi:hypothetical protein